MSLTYAQVATVNDITGCKISQKGSKLTITKKKLGGVFSSVGIDLTFVRLDYTQHGKILLFRIGDGVGLAIHVIPDGSAEILIGDFDKMDQSPAEDLKLMSKMIGLYNDGKIIRSR